MIMIESWLTSFFQNYEYKEAPYLIFLDIFWASTTNKYTVIKIVDPPPIMAYKIVIKYINIFMGIYTS